MSNIAKLTWTGLAIETAPGTAETAPTIYIPTTSKFQRKTKYVYSKEERGTRDTNNVRTGTTRMSTASLNGDAYLTSLAYFLFLHMGSLTSTQPDNLGAPTAYQQALALADTPPSATLFKGYDHSGYSFAYAVSEKLTLKFTADGKVLSVENSFQSQYGVKLEGAAYTAINDPVYDDFKAWAGYAPTITIGGAQSNVVSDMQIDLSQKITLKYTSRGNRGYYKAEFGDREAALSFTAEFEDTSFEDKEENDTRDHITVQFDGANLGGAINEQIKFDFPIVGYDEIDVDTSKEAIEVSAKCTVVPGATKNSLYTANIINTDNSFAA